jgi:hypothetical protein
MMCSRGMQRRDMGKIYKRIMGKGAEEGSVHECKEGVTLEGCRGGST